MKFFASIGSWLGLPSPKSFGLPSNTRKLVAAHKAELTATASLPADKAGTAPLAPTARPQGALKRSTLEECGIDPRRVAAAYIKQEVERQLRATPAASPPSLAGVKATVANDVSRLSPAGRAALALAPAGGATKASVPKPVNLEERMAAQITAIVQKLETSSPKVQACVRAGYRAFALRKLPQELSARLTAKARLFSALRKEVPGHPTQDDIDSAIDGKEPKTMDELLELLQCVIDELKKSKADEDKTPSSASAGIFAELRAQDPSLFTPRQTPVRHTKAEANAELFKNLRK